MSMIRKKLLGGLTPDPELTGTYTFNTETPDSIPDRDDLAVSYHEVPPYGMTLTDALGNKYEIPEGTGAVRIDIMNGRHPTPEGDTFQVVNDEVRLTIKFA